MCSILKKRKLVIFKLYTDGASRGNPGHASIGVYICDSENNSIKEISKYIGKQTNNYAEYSALIEGLKACLDNNITSINVFMDSELIVKQLKGEYKVKNENLIPLYQQVTCLKSKFTQITFKHVQRENNKKADKLANIALDKYLE